MSSLKVIPWISRMMACGLLLVATCLAGSRKEQVLYSFQGGSDGARPIGGVVFDQAGNLYGATVNGGAHTCRSLFECGTVYRLSPPAKKGGVWNETVLYVFKGTDNNDGASPFGGVIFDAAGNLYGTTGYDGTGSCQMFGGQIGCGIVYELSPPTMQGGSWRETVLYNFQGAIDGQFPYGDLVFDKQGNLYGATMYGGGYGSCNAPYYNHCGTIFELSPPQQKGGTWTEKVLYSFKNGTDGANPQGSLIFDKKGALYGTAYFGGEESGVCNGGVGGTGCGTVFQLTPPATKNGRWKFQMLHQFQGGTGDGSNPAAGVVADQFGNLYGTTFFGPQNGYGTVFELEKLAKGKLGPWRERVIYRFTDGIDGGNPMAGLIVDSSGTLYGTAMRPTSESRRGTVFTMNDSQIGKKEWKLTVLYTFRGIPDGQDPDSSLVLDQNGNSYSTTQDGGQARGQECPYGCGIVYEMTH